MGSGRFSAVGWRTGRYQCCVAFWCWVEDQKTPGLLTPLVQAEGTPAPGSCVAGGGSACPGSAVDRLACSCC